MSNSDRSLDAGSILPVFHGYLIVFYISQKRLRILDINGSFILTIKLMIDINLRIRKFSSFVTMRAFCFLTVLHVSAKLKPVVIDNLTIKLHFIQTAVSHVNFLSFANKHDKSPIIDR